MKSYKVTCLQCKESDTVTIEESGHRVIDWAKQISTNFLAARWRKDLQWGFECKCGNDNRLAKGELSDFSNLVQGDDLSIKRIADTLAIPDKEQFTMRSI
jgi:hypothetical protein